MNKVSITHMGHAHSDWLRGLDFYKNELLVLKNRLTEVAGKNTSKDVSSLVEHFENQFMIHDEAIDQLSHDIHQNTADASQELQYSGLQYIDKTLLDKYVSFKGRFTTEEKLINDLRHEFNEFAAEWM